MKKQLLIVILFIALDSLAQTSLPLLNKPLFGDALFPRALNLNAVAGVWPKHESMHIEVGYQFRNGIELGIGGGHHTNRIELPLNNVADEYRIETIPFYFSAKLFPINIDMGFWKPYAKLNYGLGINKAQNTKNTFKNSGYTEAGLGCMWRPSGGAHYILEFAFYNMHSNGTLSDETGSFSFDYDFTFTQPLVRIGAGLSIGFDYEYSEPVDW